MLTRIKEIWATSYAIISYHSYLYKQKLLDDTINFTIWALISLFVTGFLLPKMGLSSSFGTFQCCGIIANIGLWMSFSEIVYFVTDFENKQKIKYFLSLPLPSSLYFISYMAAAIIRFFALSVIIMAIVKISFWEMISFEKLSLAKLFLINMAGNIFYGSWTIFITSIIKKTKNVSMLFGRIQFPLWFMGGFQFSWETLYKVTPLLATIDLINPILYINEGYKEAILGTQSFLSCYHLIAITLIFSLVLFMWGYHRIKKQIDFV
jgi:ABC-type multidrug transport system permease subunit